MSERAHQIPDTRYQILDTKTILAYDPLFDIAAYRHLHRSKNLIGEEEFARRQNQLDLRTQHNLETNLGERFNVEISQVTYVIDQNNNLRNIEHDEPFQAIIARGQRYRQNLGSGEVEREKAEVIGFGRVQDLLATTDYGLQTKTIVISPRGDRDSVYQHNFFDVYEKENYGTVKMSRYTSKLTHEQFWQVAQFLDPSLPKPMGSVDAYFLAHPLTCDKSIEEILELFSPDEETMSNREYQELIAACTPLICAYINTLSKNPQDLKESEIKRIYNAILNFADAYVMPEDEARRMIVTPTVLSVEESVDFYGNLPVRRVMTGCGVQIGFGSNVNGQMSIVSFAPFSVAEFGITNCRECGSPGDHFHCPREKGGCGGQIPSGRSITKCPACGLTKEEAGSTC